MKKMICPICGKEERGNVKPEDLVMCSRCLMRRAIALEQAEKKAKEEDKALPHEKAVRTRSTTGGVKFLVKRRATCKKCGGKFNPGSNRQQFCQACQGESAAKNHRDRQARYRKSNDVTV